MSILHNKVFVSAVVAVGLFAWGPRILALVEGETPPADASDADPADDLNMDDGPEVVDEDAAGAPPSESMSHFMDAVETLRGGDPIDLDALLAEPPEWLAPEPRSEPAVAEPTPGDVTRRSRDDERAERAAAFLADAPLTAIVRAADGAWAMLGGRVVQAGDVLVPDLLTVRAIRPDAVVLSGPDGEVHVPLPPFRARGGSDAGPAPAGAAPDEPPVDATPEPELDSTLREVS